MKLPNRGLALIARDKLTDYVLNVAHRRGGPKARRFALEFAVQSQHVSAQVGQELRHVGPGPLAACCSQRGSQQVLVGGNLLKEAFLCSHRIKGW